MMKSATITLEAIKLQLVHNQQMTSMADPALSKEAIKYLIKALEHADPSFTQEIETVLTKSGPVAIPVLLKGLCSSSMNVKSTCSMVLVRLGEVAVEPLLQFYARHEARENIRWVAEFTLGALGEPVQRPVQPVTATHFVEQNEEALEAAI
jgi:HEAT repeat protein